MTAKEIETILKNLANPEIAEHSQRFFKMGKGEYGEGDRFLGIRVPVLRAHVKTYHAAPTAEILKLLKSPFHEIRLFALLVLVKKFAQHPAEQAQIYELYLKHTAYINNWDLVDSSAHLIVGVYLAKQDKRPLYDLAKSSDLWERRIAIMSTFHLIRQNDFTDALKISKILKNDPEDLIHKAVGWMLREIGKRDLALEKDFLKQHYATMPRTMLRYAIEKFPKAERDRYLKGVI